MRIANSPQEVLNIFVALNVLPNKWANKTIEIHCDNAGVVAVLKLSKTKGEHLATISKNIYMLFVDFDISLKISRVQDKNNVTADLLFRWEDPPVQREKFESTHTTFHMGKHS